MIAVLRRIVGILGTLVLVLIGLAVYNQRNFEDSGLKPLVTGDDSRGWEAVGRVNIGQRGYCTGALIAPDLVLTAAHCLYDSLTGERYDLSQYQFVAGLRNGGAAAYRGVRRAAAHPDYTYGEADNLFRVSHDIALLELDQPIRTTGVRPFDTTSSPSIGAPVGIVSYATGRDDAPSLEETCRVLAWRQGVLMLSCDIDFGSSGAPIFVMEAGEPRIVSVVSAKSDAFGKRVALAAQLDGSLDAVRTALEASDGVFRRVTAPGASDAPAADDAGGARGSSKFLQP